MIRLRVLLRLGFLIALFIGLTIPSSPVFAYSSNSQPNYDCDIFNPLDAANKMNSYNQLGSFTVQQLTNHSAKPQPTAVQLIIPSPKFDDKGHAQNLPVGSCQYIYRFHYSTVENPSNVFSPFKYVEIDWNTEGMPRGPNGSFVSPHFDFHFYLRTRDWIDSHLNCPTSNGKTCDPFKTDYLQMRRFLEMPEPDLIPSSYRADIDSSIPEMGLHLLDFSGNYKYEKNFVDHNPVLLYGTFNGENVFLEASVTLYTLQDVVEAKTHKKTWSVKQPKDFKTSGYWPEKFAIEYFPNKDSFAVSFEDYYSTS